MATWQLDESYCDGPPVSVVYLLAQELGLDGARVCQRGADAAR